MLLMSAEQKNDSLIAIARAVRHFHTQAGLAMVIGRDQSFISRLAAGTAELDATLAMQIEKATGGAIKRHELRPDLWERPKAAARMIEIKAAMPFKVGDRVSIPGRADLEVIDIFERKTDGKTRGGKRQKGEAEKETGGRAQSQGRPRRKAKAGEK